MHMAQKRVHRILKKFYAMCTYLVENRTDKIVNCSQ